MIHSTKWDSTRRHKQSDRYGERVYTDNFITQHGDDKFCCLCHWGEQNRLEYGLLGFTYGYSPVDDVMRIGPSNGYAGEWMTIKDFSQRTEEELRKIIRDLADARAARLNSR